VAISKLRETIELTSRLKTATMYFNTDQYREIVDEAKINFMSGAYDLCKKSLDQLPTKKQMMEKMMNTIEGKSVHKTLSRIVENRTKNIFEELKGCFSLGTHLAIECEKGNTEYRLLINELYERIGGLIFNGY